MSTFEERLALVSGTLEAAIDGLGGADVEAHRAFSDERLKTTIRDLEQGLAALRELEADPDRDGDDDRPDVEARRAWSDERLKTTIRDLEQARPGRIVVLARWRSHPVAFARGRPGAPRPRGSCDSGSRRPAA